MPDPIHQRAPERLYAWLLTGPLGRGAGLTLEVTAALATHLRVRLERSRGQG